MSLRTLTFKPVPRVNNSEIEIGVKYMDLIFCYAASTTNASAKKLSKRLLNNPNPISGRMYDNLGS